MIYQEMKFKKAATEHSFRFEFEDFNLNTLKPRSIKGSPDKLEFSNQLNLVNDQNGRKLDNINSNNTQNNLDAMNWSKRDPTTQASLIRQIHNQKYPNETRILHLNQPNLPFEGNLKSLIVHPFKSFKTTTRRIQKNTRREVNLLLYSRATLTSQILFIITAILFMSIQGSQQLPSSREISSYFAPTPHIRSPNSQKFKFLPSSSRHITPKSSFIDDSSSKSAHAFNRDNELRLRNTRLNNLKRLLDLYSYSSEIDDNSSSRQMTQLGSSCITATDCNRSIANSHCSLDTFTCSCLPNHIEHNSTTCLTPSLLGYECLIDAQCQKKVQNSFCSNNLCACPSEFVAYRKDKCLSASKIDDYCLTDKQCELNEKHSYCRWKIPHVYGVCECPPNYKHISVEQLAWPTISGNATLFRGNLSTTTATTTITTRCAPRLGDICFENAECLLATPNSHCKEAPNNLRISWQTSRASSLKRCQCMENFVESRDRMSCNLVEKQNETTPAIVERLQPSTTSTTAATTLIGQNTTPTAIVTMFDSKIDATKHHYDIVNSSGEPVSVSVATVSPKTEQDNKSTSTTSVSVSSQPINKQQQQEEQQQIINKQQIGANLNATKEEKNKIKIRVSSLGKACESRAECQLRDPHSDCINGICECKRPTAKCSAKSTGCHEDTFQCRNGQCISWYFVCDKFKNCDDGSDEDECLTNSCPPQAFQCDNGSCIARAKICNGKWDCLDGSDERSCFVNNKQKEAVNLLKNSPYLSANNINNQTTTTHQFHQSSVVGQEKCDSRTFTCANGQCLPAYVFCNAVEDCSDGSDERAQLCEVNWYRKWPAEQYGQQQKQQNQVLLSSSQYKNVTSLDLSNSKLQLLTNIPFSNNNNNNNNNVTSTKSLTSSSSSVTTNQQDSPLLKTDRNSINKMLAALNAAQLTHNNNYNSNSNKNNNKSNNIRNGSESSRGAKSWQFQDNNEIFGQRRHGNTRGRDNRIMTTHNQLASETTSQLNSKDNYLKENQSQSQYQYQYQNQEQDQKQCPKGSFTCKNGKCRSSAILCSGIDGCGDNSDENRCEVCQCEAPVY